MRIDGKGVGDESGGEVVIYEEGVKSLVM